MAPLASACGFGSWLRCSRVAFFFSVTTTPNSDTRRPGQRRLGRNDTYAVKRCGPKASPETSIKLQLAIAGQQFKGASPRHSLIFIQFHIPFTINTSKR
ncbi:hypothetical protein PGT21_023448 [Puccinia graminis f. sp. tritici]|uniref:Uncharacterized protein n=1 Tax=Puccinia graminis f. sp. tritici TaxID=56615 RepID=A0A5B0M7G5_PUCGR|nr:hypothetical protein PGT21_023448 [Puccinia graminis f. sp. tritici]